MMTTATRNGTITRKARNFRFCCVATRGRKVDRSKNFTESLVVFTASVTSWKENVNNVYYIQVSECLQLPFNVYEVI